MASNPRQRQHPVHQSRLAVPILVTLLAANFVALMLHAAFFLPLDIENGEDSLRAFISGRVQHLNGRDNGDNQETRKRKSVSSPSHAELLHSFDERNHQYIRYDAIPSQLRRSFGVVHQLPSIPERRLSRPSYQFNIPPNAVHNLTYFLEARVRDDVEDRPLYLYNPMLLPLDERFLDSSIVKDLSIVRDGAQIVSYIAVFRVSNFGNCFGPGKGVPDTYQNYLGLALLDSDLNIIMQQSTSPRSAMDAVIDLNQHLNELRWTPGGISRRKHPKPKQYMQDCQIFGAKSTPSSIKFDQLVLLCNEYAMPVQLQIIDKDRTANDDKIEVEGSTIHFANTYGSNLKLTAMEYPNMILYGGKNMHPFHATPNQSSKTIGPGFLEIWPSGPHTFTYLDFTTSPYVQRGSNGLNLANSTKKEPDSSYATIESTAHPSPITDRDSGSACCVPITWSDEDGSRMLLLGFSHRKTRKKPKENAYNYVSRVYAFEPMPPFDVVARSGLFCLGFASNQTSETEQTSNEQVAGATGLYKLTIQGTQFDCPRIHFVTGKFFLRLSLLRVALTYLSSALTRIIELLRSNREDRRRGYNHRELRRERLLSQDD